MGEGGEDRSSQDKVEVDEPDGVETATLSVVPEGKVGQGGSIANTFDFAHFTMHLPRYSRYFEVR
jgi:hypothetical protein